MSEGPSPGQLNALGKLARADLARLVVSGKLDTETCQIGGQEVNYVTLHAAAGALLEYAKRHPQEQGKRYQDYYRGCRLVDCLAAALHKVGINVRKGASEGELLFALTDLDEDLAQKRATFIESSGQVPGVGERPS